MVEIAITYDGSLRCRAVHGPSSDSLVTDAPVDNQGKGEAFSPTDLVATALGTCVATIMGIVAERNDIDLSGMTLTVRKEMATTPIRRIGALTVDVAIPRELPESDRKRLEHGARHCPVHKSLHPDIHTTINFSYA